MRCDSLLFFHFVIIGQFYLFQVIYTGGTMKIPKLQSTISALVPRAQVLSTIPPDEVVSIGCAKQSAYLSGSDYDDVAEQVDMEITTLSEDVYISYVNADGDRVSNTEKDLLFKRGALVPSLHGSTIAKQIKHPVKIAIEQGEHVDYVDSSENKDINEITARLHGGARQNNDHSFTFEPATVHIHVN